MPIGNESVVLLGEIREAQLVLGQQHDEARWTEVAFDRLVVATEVQAGSGPSVSAVACREDGHPETHVAEEREWFQAPDELHAEMDTVVADAV